MDFCHLKPQQPRGAADPAVRARARSDREPGPGSPDQQGLGSELQRPGAVAPATGSALTQFGYAVAPGGIGGLSNSDPLYFIVHVFLEPESVQVLAFLLFL